MEAVSYCLLYNMPIPCFLSLVSISSTFYPQIFFYESASYSFSLLKFWLWNFLAQKYWHKGHAQNVDEIDPWSTIWFTIYRVLQYLDKIALLLYLTIMIWKCDTFDKSFIIPLKNTNVLDYRCKTEEKKVLCYLVFFSKRSAIFLSTCFLWEQHSVHGLKFNPSFAPFFCVGFVGSSHINMHVIRKKTFFTKVEFTKLKIIKEIYPISWSNKTFFFANKGFSRLWLLSEVILLSMIFFSVYVLTLKLNSKKSEKKERKVL